MKIFTSIVALALTTVSFGQTYDFNTFTEGYNDLVASTSLNNGVSWDDPFFSIPIGFTFNYFDEPTTIIDISDDGLGAFLAIGDCGTDPTQSLLIPYGADIIDRGDDGPVSLSNISYLTEGTAGSRICKIEWNNVGFFDGITDANGNRVDFLNFQLWLYETTDVIEVRFGPKSISDPQSAFEGQTGTIVALLDEFDCATDLFNGEQLVLGGVPSTPTYYQNDFDVNDSIVYIDGIVPEMTVYQFTPAPIVSQEELSSITPFSIVPNPAYNQLQIVNDEYSSEEIRRASIIDFSGKILYDNLDFNQEISVSELKAGMYFVQVEMDSGRMYSEKFTKR